MSIDVKDRAIGDYLDQLASSAPTPGGGSVAGVIAALAMSLGRMVISLSDPSPELMAANDRLIEAGRGAIAGSDADERAYGGYITASKLPRATPEEKAHRKAHMQRTLRDAAETPMCLAELIHEMKPTLQHVVRLGNPHVVSDAAIGLLFADAAIEACLINVRVNLPYLKDDLLIADLQVRISNIIGDQRQPPE